MLYLSFSQFIVFFFSRLLSLAFTKDEIASRLVEAHLIVPQQVDGTIQNQFYGAASTKHVNAGGCKLEARCAVIGRAIECKVSPLDSGM